MKAIFILLSFMFAGCFQHWEDPSKKLATQADNYLSNDRAQFFYRYCYLYGNALNCLIGKDSLADCKETLDKAKSFQVANYENAKRFISPSSVDHIKLRQAQKKPKNETEAINSMKQGFQYTIDTFTDKEWPQCKEVASIK